ncbi:MAG TPA: PIN domain-containing protein [Anaerolineales bacterium]|nr:PIN domain-containing protein [Anaerolineales bacterium]
MPKINLFLDSSALFSGIVSSTGGARALLLLAESNQILITISEQVVAETERAIARKVPKALADLREAILASNVQIVHDPSPKEVQANLHLISHAADVPIILAAMGANVDFLVTHNRIHFIDDPEVAVRSSLKIGTPGDALIWVREQISSER